MSEIRSRLGQQQGSWGSAWRRPRWDTGMECQESSEEGSGQCQSGEDCYRCWKWPQSMVEEVGKHPHS